VLATCNVKAGLYGLCSRVLQVLASCLPHSYMHADTRRGAVEVQYVDMSRGTVSKGLVSGVRHSSLVTPNGNAGL